MRTPTSRGGQVGILMDLIAGDAREILLAVGTEDWAGLRDRGRFPAYISLGGGMDPEWLDLFALAARESTGGNTPGSFTDAACPLESRLQHRLAAIGDRTIERIDPHWIDGLARLPDGQVDRIAARWIDLIDLEECARSMPTRSRCFARLPAILSTSAVGPKALKTSFSPGRCKGDHPGICDAAAPTATIRAGDVVDPLCGARSRAFKRARSAPQLRPDLARLAVRFADARGCQ